MTLKELKKQRASLGRELVEAEAVYITLMGGAQLMDNLIAQAEANQSARGQQAEAAEGRQESPAAA